MRLRLTAATACLLLATTARADAPSVDASESDPGSGLMLVTSTALTRPAGSVTVASHMGLTGATYGVNDHVEIAGYILPVFAVTGDPVGGGLVTAKIGTGNHGRTRAAIELRGGALRERYVTQWYGEATAIGTQCLDDACVAQISASATLGGWATYGSTDDGGGERDTLLRVGAGAQVPLASYLTLVADASLWVGSGDRDMLLAGGLRLHGRSWMVQGSAVAALGGGTPSVLPWLSAAYRF